MNDKHPSNTAETIVQKHIRNTALAITLISTLATATGSIAAGLNNIGVCGIGEQLEQQNRELRRVISVPKRDYDFVAGFDISLRKGLFGKYINTTDVIASLDQNGCDAGLVEYLLGKAKRVKDRGGNGGGDTGGGNGSGPGNTGSNNL